MFTQRETNLFKRVAKVALAEYFPSREVNIDDVLGSGAYGVAFSIDNHKDYAIKVTQNLTEATVVNAKLLNHNKEHVIDYYYVAKVNVSNNVLDKFNVHYSYNKLYCIIMERITANCDTKRDFDKIENFLEGHLLNKYTYIKDRFIENLKVKYLLTDKSEVLRGTLFDDMYNPETDSINRGITKTGIIPYFNFNLFNWDDYKDKIKIKDSKKVHKILTDIIGKYRDEVFNINLKDIFTKEYILDKYSDSLLKLNLKTAKDLNGIIKLIESYYDLKYDIQSLGIRNNDLHDENVGVKDGKFKVFDIMDGSIDYLGDCPVHNINEEVKRVLKSIYY